MKRWKKWKARDATRILCVHFLLRQFDWPIKLARHCEKGMKKVDGRRWKHRFKQGKNPRRSETLRYRWVLSIERSSGWNLKKVPRFVFFPFFPLFPSSSLPSLSLRFPAFQSSSRNYGARSWAVARKLGRLTADFYPVSASAAWKEILERLRVSLVAAK